MNIFPTKHEKLIAVAIISFLAGILLVFLTKLKVDEYAAGFIALFAAFFGAYSAFLLQNKKQEKELILKRVEAGNKAIFKLSRVHNSFASYHKQFIKGSEHKPERFVSIQPSLHTYESTDFDFDSLAYLIEINHPNLLHNLSMFQSYLESIIELIKKRSDLHLNVYQPAIEAAGYSEGETLSDKDITKILGERNETMLKSYTEKMIEGVNYIIENSEALTAQLGEAHMESYKGHKVLTFSRVKD